jgi:hypothetical protein
MRIGITIIAAITKKITVITIGFFKIGSNFASKDIIYNIDGFCYKNEDKEI